MKYISIRTKLGLLVGICSFGIIGLLITVATVVERNQAVERARLDALIRAEKLATQVMLEFEKVLSTSRTLAQAFSASKEQSLLTLERGPANTILRGVLAHNPTFLAVYSVWEPNAFDNLDVAFANWEGHDQTGRFVPYWVRDAAGEIFLEAVRDYQTQAKGDFYNISRVTGREVILNPQFYSVRDETRLIVSVVTPIMLQDTFLGVTGVDLHLDWLQQLADGTAREHNASIAIVANDGSLAAISGQPEQAGAFLIDLDYAYMPHLSAIYHGRERIIREDDHLLIFTPVHLGDALGPWSIKLALSEKHIIAQASANMWRQIAMGLSVSALVVLLILFFVERMIKPLGDISAAALKLARGNLDYQKIRTARDEIGLVNDSFHQMTQGLKNNIIILQAIAAGDFSRETRLRSQEDELGQTVNLLVDNLRKITRQLNRIAREGYTERTIKPFSDRDELGKALGDMSATLKRVRNENRRQQELQEGRVKLNDGLRGEQDLATLAQNIIRFICRHLNLPMGALFVVDDTSGKLRLRSTCAAPPHASRPDVFAFGEGLVGRVALEQERLMIDDLPDDYMPIQSGLGGARPCGIVLIPLIHNQRVLGVLELGSLTPLSAETLTFLELAAENIAIALHSCLAREHTQFLLAQTREQAEMLQQQQDHLKQSNRDLAEQTRALKESEFRLQQQQEELRQTNQELQEKAQLLQAQKEDIQKKNLELKMARDLIEEKMRDLEITGKYKSEFLANMSHELRTPLNSILLLSRMIADNKWENLNDRQVEFAGTIYASGTDLLNLINDILDLSKIEAGRMHFYYEETSLTTLVRELERNFVHLARDKGLHFHVEVSDDAPRSISTDGQRVSQILKNFLSNAFKFTRQGSVRLAVAMAARAARGSLMGADREGPQDAVAFSVSDTGIGIAPDKQKIIFEAFQQADGATSRQYGGTGLGLSISLEIARQLGGEIQLHSVPGQGSRFTLLLPLQRSNEPSGSPFHQPEQALNGMPLPALAQAETSATDKTLLTKDTTGTMAFIRDDRSTIKADDPVILIIEDDSHFARVLADLSREKGFKVLIADSGETGLHFADYYQPEAILLDVDLPGLDGWAVLTRLKEQPRTRHIPVHFISATDDPLDALRRGAIGFTGKPVDMEALETIYQRIAQLAPQTVRRLLIVEDDPVQQQSLIDLLDGPDIDIRIAVTGQQALDDLRKHSFDCAIVDLGLPDISGTALLARLRKELRLRGLPVIVYSAKDLTREEEALIDQYAEKIIIKGVKSPEKLLDETSLFLHRALAGLSPEQQQMLAWKPEPEAVFANRNILLADDDMRNVFAVSSVLESKGLTMRIARNGQQALELMAQETDVDLVLMDIMMPVMDGYAAMREIRKQNQFREIPIIALTAKAMEGDRSLCIDAGASDYLAKPFDMDKLLSMLRVWLYRE